MRVNEIMTEPAVTVSSEASLATAIDLMAEHAVTGLAVVDASNQLCGILSEGDLMRRLELGTAAERKGWWAVFTDPAGPAEAYRRANGRQVRDVMSATPVTIDTGASLADAAELMEKSRCRRLPVLQGGELIGMITRADFVRALRRFVVPVVATRVVSDSEIRHKILVTLGQEQWAANCAIDVSVAGGRVLLEGGVPNDDQRRAALVAAENAEGVVSVSDKLQIYETIVRSGFLERVHKSCKLL